MSDTPTQADDLVQDAYERAMRNLHLDQYRKRQRRPRQMRPDDDAVTLPVRGNQMPRLELRYVAQRISDLDKGEQVLLNRIVGHGRSHKEVAVEFDVAVDTIKSRLSRIRAKIAAG